jgi:hypothetical protein
MIKNNTESKQSPEKRQFFYGAIPNYCYKVAPVVPESSVLYPEDEFQSRGFRRRMRGFGQLLVGALQSSIQSGERSEDEWGEVLTDLSKSLDVGHLLYNNDAQSPNLAAMRLIYEVNPHIHWFRGGDLQTRDLGGDRSIAVPDGIYGYMGVLVKAAESGIKGYGGTIRENPTLYSVPIAGIIEGLENRVLQIGTGHFSTLL